MACMLPPAPVPTILLVFFGIGDFPVACFNRRPSFTTRVHLGDTTAPFAFMAPIAALVVLSGAGVALSEPRLEVSQLPPAWLHEPGV
jgi:hypothetical protein